MIPSPDDLSALAASDIDSLPFGYIALAADGTIRRYNRFEADLARKDPAEVLGRNFFREVAPCTQVREFEGRFRDFVSGAVAEPAIAFDFVFVFRHGTQRVRIGLVRSPLASEVIVTVNRVRRLDLPTGAGVREDPVRGSLEDAAGARVVVAGEDFFAALEATWRPLPARERRERMTRLGRDWGIRHAERVDRLVQRAHGVTLREAELQLALECLSGSLGPLGLGRFDVDLGQRGRGIVVVEHRHAPFPTWSALEPGRCDLLAGLHAGFVGHLAGRTLGGVEVRCGRDAGGDCRFVVGTESRLEALTRPDAAPADAALLAEIAGVAPAVATAGGRG